MSILLTVVILCLFSYSSAADVPMNSVKIKLISAGTDWFRFVERNGKSDLLVGMGEIECDGKSLLYTKTLSVIQEVKPKSNWLSGYEFSDPLDCKDWIRSSIRVLYEHPAIVSWNEQGIPSLNFLEESIDSDTQNTLDMMKDLRTDYLARPELKIVLCYFIRDQGLNMSISTSMDFL